MSDSIDWDSFGHCVLCHKNMAFKQVVGQKEIQRFAPDYCEGEYLLNDASRMKVALCSKCKSEITEASYPTIEDSVIRGWEQEIKHIGWSEEKQAEYMAKYSKIKIVCDAEGKPNDYLIAKLKEYRDGNSQ